MDYFIKQHNTTYRNIKIKTASDLKHWHLLLNPGSYHFDRKTMKFFGDTMANYGLKNHDGLYFELYRKKPVKHGLAESVFFNPKTLTRIYDLKTYIRELVLDPNYMNISLEIKEA